MSFRLINGTVPDEIEVKTRPSSIDTDVRIGKYEISISDFCAMVRYVLTNTDLENVDDPRIQLVADIQKAERTAGHDNSAERFVLPN